MDKLNITNITAKRESLSLLDAEAGHNTTWDYLTLYNQDNEIITRSKRHHTEGTIELIYEGLLFFAPPISKDHTEYISISFNSLKTFKDLFTELEVIDPAKGFSMSQFAKALESIPWMEKDDAKDIYKEVEKHFKSIKIE